MNYDYAKNMFNVEKKWTKRFAEEKLFVGKINKNKKKFFLTVPYPYTSGALHIGHGRTFATADFIARWKRKQNYNVFWPIAYHVSGMPVIAMCDGLKRGDEKTINMIKHYILNYEKDESKVQEILEKIKEPEEFAKYFASKFANDFRNIGLSLDFTREFTTMEPWYNDFVSWQYINLKEKNMLVKDDYPVLFDPVDGNAVGEDDIKDGDTDKVEKQEFKMFNFKLEEKKAKELGYDLLYLAASTLRPETVFAVTNLWINPNDEYSIVEIEGKDGFYIMSKEAAYKLSFQREIKELETIKGEKLVLSKVSILDKEVYVLPADFVDKDIATGVVYSVPAHAPFDYIALKEVQNRDDEIGKIARQISLIPLVEIKGYSEFSAKDVCEKLKIFSLEEKEKLEEATKILYKDEYYNGKLNENAGKFKGLKIKEIKNQIVDWLKEQNLVDVFYETSRKAITRSGHKVIVAMLKDQWFLDYSNKELKEKTKAHINKMLVVPEKFRTAMLNAIDWVEKRPCARKRGLGTKLPFDKDWVIESLSDSTIYMAFYTIADKLIPVYKENLNKNENYKLERDFFDYVFYGKGNPKDLADKYNFEEKIIKEMRESFDYWYGVDLRHTAPAHISNHLTFYLMQHMVLFNDRLPKAQTFNDMLIREGQKMSKSKGNIISLVSITEKYGVDIYRLYVASNADLDKLVDWREDEVKGLKSKYLQLAEVLENAVSAENLKKDDFDKVFLAKFYNLMENAYNSYENFKFREAMVEGFFKVLNLIKKYENFTSKDSAPFVKEIMPSWLKVLEPVMPFITQEYWSKINNGFIALETFTLDEIKKYKNKKQLEIFSYVETLIEDLNNIKNISKPKENIAYLYVSENWKYKILENLDKQIKELLNLNEDKKEVAKIYQILKKRVRKPIKVEFNETKVLENWKEVIEKQTGLKIKINVDEDPLNKKKQSLPLKPSIYMF